MDNVCIDVASSRAQMQLMEPVYFVQLWNTFYPRESNAPKCLLLLIFMVSTKKEPPLQQCELIALLCIELLAHNIISPTEHRIKLLTMEILSQSCTVQSSSSHSKQQADEVVFLYRVVPGSRACNSYGAWCASIAGIPAPIVQRGK